MQRIITDFIPYRTITSPSDERSVKDLYDKYTKGLPVYGTPSPRIYDNNRDMVVNPLNHFGIDLTELQQAKFAYDKVQSALKKMQEVANTASNDTVTVEQQ